MHETVHYKLDNIAAVAVLAYASAVFGLATIFLQLAVGLHAALTVWCIACLRSASVNAGDRK